jgi:hypothetical protein
MLMVSAEAFAKKEACIIIINTRNDFAESKNTLDDLNPISFTRKRVKWKIFLLTKENI